MRIEVVAPHTVAICAGETGGSSGQAVRILRLPELLYSSSERESFGGIPPTGVTRESDEPVFRSGAGFVPDVVEAVLDPFPPPSSAPLPDDARAAAPIGRAPPFNFC